MKYFLVTAIAALTLTFPASAQDEPQGAPSPNEIVEQAPPADWISISPDDLLVMDLAPDSERNARQVIIQLMPAPFSQGWVENIRTLARARWYDGISVNRVQDNYVVQWGDPGHDNPESGGAETKPLPDGLNVMGEEDYAVQGAAFTSFRNDVLELAKRRAEIESADLRAAASAVEATRAGNPTIAIMRSQAPLVLVQKDSYAPAAKFENGWPVGFGEDALWPVHCYGMVGVGRNYSPDTGSGAELYTVIGHAPRHLDRNIALVGRIVSGMEHLSSLPRGSGTLGFYTEEEADKRTPILSIRVASDLPEGERPAFEYLSTGGETFARYADSRANRRDPFFIAPAGGADICNIPAPVRPAAGE
ncbi:peptidylprolyl isomerase [Erythrobacter ani]|uniref:Peptidylprolyl isomerase n=1 Tax=Erythrobacter ani TaxID=2827235 RepID=A0ABS6SMG0_9SPHN|nr:peptidylprolyl isomerase [Erythrobacter ani]MBV7266230.1 peptidylprolyl isomerase [Erythrobacter ani]